MASNQPKSTSRTISVTSAIRCSSEVVLVVSATVLVVVLDVELEGATVAVVGAGSVVHDARTSARTATKAMVKVNQVLATTGGRLDQSADGCAQ